MKKVVKITVNNEKVAELKGMAHPIITGVCKL
ncbi:hypothetical protein P615_04140 [Brevibacillus laterosporus PE36]|nr:hypothetical protein P615_04140 [Brevibacillus laterosporus PE36]